MAEYTYEALGSTGVRTHGTLVAGSEREVMAMLDAVNDRRQRPVWSPSAPGSLRSRQRACSVESVVVEMRKLLADHRRGSTPPRSRSAK